MPELAGRPEWNIDIGRIHDWLAEIADRIERREMHNRKRYWVSSTDPETTGDGDPGMVEIVNPVENPTFCANCHRVRATHNGYLKGCLNRNDGAASIATMTCSRRAR